MRPFKTPRSPSYHNSFQSGWLDFSNARKHTDRVQGFIRNQLERCGSDQRQSCTHAAAWRTCWRRTASPRRLQECQLCPHAHVTSLPAGLEVTFQVSSETFSPVWGWCVVLSRLKSKYYTFDFNVKTTWTLFNNKKLIFILFKSKDSDLSVLLYHH